MLEKAIAHHRAGEFDEAEALYRLLLQKEPDNLDALHWFGVLSHQLGRLDEAVQMLSRVTESKPGASGSYAYLCLALRDQGKLPEAIAAGQTSLQLFPANHELCNVVGRLFQRTGDWRRACTLFRHAIHLNPEYADAYHNLAIALESHGHSLEACEVYRQALALDPGNAQLYYNLGLSRLSLGHYADALSSVERALELDAGHLQARYTRAYLRRFMCDWDGHALETKDLEEALLAHVANRGQAEIAPFALNIISVSPACHRAVAAYYARQAAQRVAGVSTAFTHDTQQLHEHSKLRVGYMSPDFRNHAVGLLVHDLFKHHDREAFEVFAYSLHRSEDRYQRAVRNGVDVFRDVSGTGAADIARTIHDDEIDILVDLGGFTWGTRPEVVALRPAPVQISWLGYLNTMGADYIDYIIADRIVLPAEQERNYSESVIRLPVSFMPMPRLDCAGSPPSRSDLGLPKGAFVFASFNSPYKIGPEEFDVWLEILERAPKAVLWLYTADLEGARRSLRNRVRTLERAAERVVFAPTVPLSEHLLRLSHADLFLDTFRYNAGASAVVALQRQVPVLTLPGNRFLSRMGASLNEAVGLTDLVCRSTGDYKAKALALSQTPAVHQQVRARLAGAAESGKAFELNNFVAGLEAAYRHAWARKRAGKPPESISLV